ncbi:MAG TPA: response regulator [Candidatus Acidoferrum sp.]|jgi:CheY-like chemotaxis protein|nr:response regulator [Candidatus Acidoferrum sp.]
MEPHLDILLVDDNRADLDLFGMAVEKSGVNICLQNLTAGQQAIDYLAAKGAYTDRSLHPLPDVIVLDLKMPQVNGFDFLAWRKASPVFSSIPVVVVSGSADPNDVRRAIALGANKHITKPVDFLGWIAVVREIWDFGTEGTASLRVGPTSHASQ